VLKNEEIKPCGAIMPILYKIKINHPLIVFLQTTARQLRKLCASITSTEYFRKFPAPISSSAKRKKFFTPQKNIQQRRMIFIT